MLIYYHVDVPCRPFSALFYRHGTEGTANLWYPHVSMESGVYQTWLESCPMTKMIMLGPYWSISGITISENASWYERSPDPFGRGMLTLNPNPSNLPT